MDKLFFVLLIWLCCTTMVIYAECSLPNAEGSICSLEELQKEQQRLEELLSKHKISDKVVTDKEHHIKQSGENKIELPQKHIGQPDSQKSLNDSSKLKD